MESAIVGQARAWFGVRLSSNCLPHSARPGYTSGNRIHPEKDTLQECLFVCKLQTIDLCWRM